MPPALVQFPVDEEVIADLRRDGLDPNTFGKDAFDRALRRRRAESMVRRAGEVQAVLPLPVEHVVREMRDSGGGDRDGGR